MRVLPSSSQTTFLLQLCPCSQLCTTPNLKLSLLIPPHVTEANPKNRGLLCKTRDCAVLRQLETRRYSSQISAQISASAFPPSKTKKTGSSSLPSTYAPVSASTYIRTFTPHTKQLLLWRDAWYIGHHVRPHHMISSNISITSIVRVSEKLPHDAHGCQN